MYLIFVEVSESVHKPRVCRYCHSITESGEERFEVNGVEEPRGEDVFIGEVDDALNVVNIPVCRKANQGQHTSQRYNVLLSTVDTRHWFTHICN